MKKHITYQEAILSRISEFKTKTNKNTIKGFIYTILTICIFSITTFVIPDTKDAGTTIQASTTTIVDVFIGYKEKLDDALEKSHKKVKRERKLAQGTDEISGDVNVVKDEYISNDAPEFATFENIAISTSKVGNSKPQKINGLIKFKPAKKIIIEKPVEKVEDFEFVDVEKYPAYDKSELMRNLKYPELARRIGISGKVIIQVMIESNGTIGVLKVLQTDNEIFNDAAINALSSVSFSPAIQNGIPVRCSVIVPIVFRLN